MKRKTHTHYIFGKGEKGIRKEHLLSLNHSENTTRLRHQQEIKFYDAFGKHDYNF